jgi:hypothetical protein
MVLGFSLEPKIALPLEHKPFLSFNHGKLNERINKAFASSMLIKD